MTGRGQGRCGEGEGGKKCLNLSSFQTPLGHVEMGNVIEILLFSFFKSVCFEGWGDTLLRWKLSTVISGEFRHKHTHARTHTHTHRESTQLNYRLTQREITDLVLRAFSLILSLISVIEVAFLPS